MSSDRAFVGLFGEILVEDLGPGIATSTNSHLHMHENCAATSGVNSLTISGCVAGNIAWKVNLCHLFSQHKWSRDSARSDIKIAIKRGFGSFIDCILGSVSL